MMAYADPDTTPGPDVPVPDPPTDQDILVKMFLIDWLALTVWLKYQRQTGQRRAWAMELHDELIAAYRPSWSQRKLPDHRHSIEEHPLRAEWRPLIEEFGGDPQMSRAGRVLIDGQALPLLNRLLTLS